MDNDVSSRFIITIIIIISILYCRLKAGRITACQPSDPELGVYALLYGSQSAANLRTGDGRRRLKRDLWCLVVRFTIAPLR